MRKITITKAIIGAGLSAVLVGTAIPAASALQPTYPQKQTSVSDNLQPPTITQSLAAKADKYVTIESDRFHVSPAASQHLSSSELEKVESAVNSTNSKLAASGEFTIEQSEKTLSLYPKKSVNVGNERLAAASAQTGGVTKIDVNWRGALVHLSNKDALLASAGISVAGVWIPEPIVSKAFATLGIVGGAALANDGRGIWFNFTYAPIGVNASGWQ